MFYGNNYGEILAYWYFRLNGFFVLSNYVVHGLTELSPNCSTDIDLLAVRFPYVKEEIGGLEADWDAQFLGSIQISKKNDCINPLDKIIACIVEIKTGNQLSRDNIDKSFKKERLLYALNRFGIFSQEENKSILVDLERDQSTYYNNVLFCKILISNKEKIGSWLWLSLQHVNEFLKQRFKRHACNKNRDRMFFTEPLIQYLASGMMNPGECSDLNGVHCID